MKYFPLFYKLGASSIVIVGGGPIALSKLNTILPYAHKITIISPKLDSDIEDLSKNNESIEILYCKYNKKLLSDADIIIAATNNKILNEEISQDAKTLGKIINVVDDPDKSNFIFGSILSRGNLLAAISTAGLSPVLTRVIKNKLESVLPRNLDSLQGFISKYREYIKKKFTDIKTRRLFWQEILEGAVIEEIEAGNIEKANLMFNKAVENYGKKKESAVYFIGAGPGDPELLTIKASRLISKADIILHDRLVSTEILNYARKEARIINVGKEKGHHLYSQDKINELLVFYAEQGNIIVRLKGGDPSIFGHLYEEIDVIKPLGVSYQVIPGITSAAAAAAYSGISLTSRDIAKSVRIITINKDDINNAELWNDLGKTKDTLVFYMAMSQVFTIAAKLQEYGRDKNTGMMLIEQATTPYQKSYRSNLDEFESKFKNDKFYSPSLVIVGNVVKLVDKYSWKEETNTGVYFNSTKFLQDNGI